MSEPLNADQCGVMNLCELPKGHEGPHQTSVDRAAGLDAAQGYLVFEGPNGELMRTPYKAVPLDRDRAAVQAPTAGEPRTEAGRALTIEYGYSNASYHRARELVLRIEAEAVRAYRDALRDAYTMLPPDRVGLLRPMTQALMGDLTCIGSNPDHASVEDKGDCEDCRTGEETHAAR